MRGLALDVIYSVRLLKSTPIGTVFALITFALGIGFNTAVFTIMNTVLLRSLPYSDPDQLVSVWELQDTTTNVPLSGPDFNDFRTRNTAFTDVSAYDNYASFDTVENSRTIHIRAAMVSSTFFRTLGIAPVRGRGFLLTEEQRGRDRVAILSYRFCQQHFGEQAQVIGKTIALNEDPFVIVGIMPRDFWFPDMNVDLWTPLSDSPVSLDADDMRKRDVRWLKVIARLRAGITIEQSRADATSIAAALRSENGSEDRAIGITVASLRAWITKDVRRPLLLIQLAGIALLFIACLNISSFLIVQLAGHRADFATRVALGAGRISICRQLLIQGFLLATISCIGGLLFAWSAIRCVSFINPDILPLSQRIADR